MVLSSDTSRFDHRRLSSQAGPPSKLEQHRHFLPWRLGVLTLREYSSTKAEPAFFAYTFTAWYLGQPFSISRAQVTVCVSNTKNFKFVVSILVFSFAVRKFYTNLVAPSRCGLHVDCISNWQTVSCSCCGDNGFCCRQPRSITGSPLL